jgi:hypothetical protein
VKQIVSSILSHPNSRAPVFGRRCAAIYFLKGRAFPIAHFCVRNARAQAIVGKVFNMPQGAHRARYNLSQHKLSQQKNGPGKPGPFESINSRCKRARKSQRLEAANFQASESEVGKVAVACRDAGGGCEQAVDRGQQASENSGGRSEGGGVGLGHLGPLSEARRRAALRSGNNLGIPDASGNRFVCIAAIWRVQCNIGTLD